jgi:hypothetical protein
MNGKIYFFTLDKKKLDTSIKERHPVEKPGGYIVKYAQTKFGVNFSQATKVCVLCIGSIQLSCIFTRLSSRGNCMDTRYDSFEVKYGVRQH